jgi:hypothetical protein
MENSMEAGLEAFIKEYAKQVNLSEVSVALLAGAMSYKAIHKLEDYKKFVITLNNVAPQLISYVKIAEGEPND